MPLFLLSPTTKDPCLRCGLPKRARANRGLTLIELLVVMVILSMVTVATIPLMQPPSGERKIREAARNVATTFELARARATEIGRPAGVWIEPQNKGPNGEVEAYKLFLCDIPPPYSGDTTTSTAQTVRSTGVASNRITTVTLSAPNSASALCKYGDRIRFNFRGPYYKIIQSKANHNDGNSIGSTFQLLANDAPDYAPEPAEFDYVPFEIIRQPVKSSITPTILTTNAPASVVDLTQSGIGNSDDPNAHAPAAFGHGNNAKPVIVTFTPTGRVHQVQHYDGTDMEIDQPTAMIYLLVRLRKEQGLIENGVAYDVTKAHKDLSAYWIGINPTTGLISVAAVYSDIVDADNHNKQLRQSRTLATSGRIEGGN